MFGLSRVEIVGLIHEAREALKEFRNMSQKMDTAILNLKAAEADFQDTKQKMIKFIDRANAFMATATDDSADAAAVQAVADQLRADGVALRNEITPNPGTQPADPSALPVTA